MRNWWKRKMLNNYETRNINVKCKIAAICLKEKNNMEKIINVRVKKLPEGMYLATSDEIQGIVAQGRTIAETLEIARDAAKKLLELQKTPINQHEEKVDNARLSIVVGL